MKARLSFPHRAIALLGVLAALATSAITASAATAFVNLTSTAQTIRGFGGATVFIPTSALTTTELDKLFGNGTGQIGFSLLRIRIATDSAWRAIELANAQGAKARGASVIATPWSPPANMKSNNSLIGGSLNTGSYAAYATYLNDFANYMSSNGASLYALSVQNEPDISVTYESCNWTATQLLNFCKNNAGAITATKVIMPESFNFNHAMSDPTLNDATAAANIDIIGGHIYGGGLASYALATSKGKEVWMTEHLVNDTTWSGALATGKEIHDCMTVANFNAYIWWYLKRSYGPMDDSDNVTKRGYVMSQYTKFVRPGYVRVNATYNPTTSVYVSAYKGSKVVIVAINQGTSAVSQTFTVQNGTVTAVTPRRTSSSENLVTLGSITLSGGSFTTSLPAQSITTFVQN